LEREPPLANSAQVGICVRWPRTKQPAETERTRDLYAPVIKPLGYGDITTEIAPLGSLYYAEGYHQQYLHKNPNGYRCHSNTGVPFPTEYGRLGGSRFLGAVDRDTAITATSPSAQTAAAPSRTAPEHTRSLNRWNAKPPSTAPFCSAFRRSTMTDMSGRQTLDRVVEDNLRDYSRNMSLTARRHGGEPGRAFR
jgi:hypothetical protein